MTSKPPVPPEICILLALYQGETFLPQQLDSYAAQTHGNWSLLVSDDGCTDASLQQLETFRASHPDHAITLRKGPQSGFVRNFLSLLQAAPPDVPYVALSDQDDVWNPDKLDRAVQRLQEVPDTIPALYCAATTICDEELNILGQSSRFQRPPAFGNALVQSIGGGNTMVLNRAALDLAAAAAAEASDPVAHDWWLYQLITGCGGQILRDPEPVLLYRQHPDNLIGANLSTRARVSRILALLNGRFLRWNTVGLAALAASEHRLTAQARQVLTTYRAARHGPVWRRLRALRASGVYRQSSTGTLALYAACLLNRL